MQEQQPETTPEADGFEGYYEERVSPPDRGTRFLEAWIVKISDGRVVRPRHPAMLAAVVWPEDEPQERASIRLAEKCRYRLVRTTALCPTPTPGSFWYLPISARS